MSANNPQDLGLLAKLVLILAALLFTGVSAAAVRRQAVAAMKIAPTETPSGARKASSIFRRSERQYRMNP